MAEDSTSKPPDPGRILDHNGEPLEEEVDLFHDPPADIGEIQTAHSALKKSEKPRSRRLQGAMVGGSGLLGALVGMVVVWLFSVDSSFLVALWPLAGGGFGALAGWGLASFSHEVTYVGDKGMAQISCAGARERFHTDHELLFKDAATLRTRVYAHYTNNVYVRTDYSYEWSDASGGRLLKIAGTHYSADNNPASGSPFHYANSAERSWTVHLLERAEQQLKSHGRVSFPLKDGGGVAVGEGSLWIQIDGESHRLDSQEIGSIDILGGTFQVRSTEAHEGWFRRRGIYEFDYADLANAKLFLITLERLLGFGLR